MSAHGWPRPYRVVVLGGGLTGATVAYHLARGAPPGSVAIDVVEPRETLGAGLAYSTAEPTHRINVPAAKMTIRTDDPNHFVAWLSRPDGPVLSAGTATLRGDLFPQRGVFGDYVRRQLAPAIASGQVRHVRDEARAVRRAGAGYAVSTAHGDTLGCDALVVATTHPRPEVPDQLAPLHEGSAIVADPHDAAALAEIGVDERTLVVGCGLTAADLIAALHARGHRGEIVALSRRGWRSRGHGPTQPDTSADFLGSPSATARGLLRSVRAAVAADAARGLSWHPALDKAREQGGAIWAALPDVERRRLLRHLRQAWEAYRFRLPPQVEDVIEALVRAGRLRFVSGRLVGAKAVPGGASVTWRARGSGRSIEDRFDRIVVATGPGLRSLTSGGGPIASLMRAGVLVPDGFGLGLAVDGASRALDAEGGAAPSLFVAGPLARGTFGELMGVPEIVAHAESVAAAILDLASSARRPARRAS